MYLLNKKIVLGIGIFISLPVLAMLIVAWTMTSNIMYPRYVCSEQHFIYCGDPSQLGLRFEDISFTADDGYELNSWYIPAHQSTKAVIFVHGLGADRHEGMRWFSAIHKAGFNILALDLRNSGKNRPAFSSMGYFEKKDVQAAVDYLYRQTQVQSVGIFGTSMGAVTSIMAMDKDSRIGAGVFEAGWSNLNDLFTQLITKQLGLPSFVLLPLISWILEWRTGLDMDQLNPQQILGDITPRPVFIIHCTGDRLIDFSHGERNFEAANEPKEFWQSSCQTHARAWQSDPDYIEKRVTKYYLKYL